MRGFVLAAMLIAACGLSFLSFSQDAAAPQVVALYRPSR